MPNTAVLAAALTDHSTHPWGLFIDGLDVIRQPGSTGNAYGTPVQDVHVKELGPWGVSSLDVDVDDPLASLSFSDNAAVEFWDLSGSRLIFRGRLDSIGVSPGFGIGRTWNLSAIGLESLLDEAIVPPATVVSGTKLPTAIATLANLYAPWIKAPFLDAGTLPYTGAGSFDYPIGTLHAAGVGADTLVNGTWTWTGGTLREAITSLAAQSVLLLAGTGIIQYGVPILVTLDFFYGLRVWQDLPTVQPDDYTTLTVTDTYAGTTTAEGLDYQREPGDVIRGAYVVGAASALFGPYSDGSGKRGKTILITDTNVTTEDQALTRAAGVLALQAPAVKGSFGLSDWTPAATLHAGSILSITDSNTSATGTYRVFAIDRTFNPSGRENWTVSFGGLPPSVAALTRRLTRSTLT